MHLSRFWGALQCSNAAGFSGLALVQLTSRNGPKVDFGANQVSPQAIKAVCPYGLAECREDVADAFWNQPDETILQVAGSHPGNPGLSSGY